MFNNLIGKNNELGRFLFCERYTLPPVKNAMFIAEGQELKRGAVVDVNGVLVGTNSLIPYAVLEFDCDTRDGGKEASVFIKGEFNFDKLSFADGLSKDDMDNIVYNGSGIGIVIKPYAFDKEFSPKGAGGGGSTGYTQRNVNVSIVDNVHTLAGVSNRSVTVASISQDGALSWKITIDNDCTDAVVILRDSRNYAIYPSDIEIVRNGTPLTLYGTKGQIVEGSVEDEGCSLEFTPFFNGIGESDIGSAEIIIRICGDIALLSFTVV